MIVTDTLVFVHLHKSGGTFVNTLLMRYAAGARRVGYHLPYRELPAASRHLPVLGVVRNPWAYYVSWFHFQRGAQRPNALFRLCSDDGTLGFADTAANLLNLHRDTARLDLLEAACPEHFQPAGLNLTRRCVRDLRASGVGFYTFLHDRMYHGADQPMIARMERLRDDLDSILRRTGDLPDDRIAHFLRDAPALNVTHHDEYRHYYDARLRDLVADRDKTIIAAYGYVFQG